MSEFVAHRPKLPAALRPAPVRPGVDAGVFPEHAREVLAAGKPAVQNDLGDGAVGVAQQFLRVQNAYLSTFQFLGGLGLLLGTFGLAVVLIRGVLERRTELALLRAVGFPGRRLAALVIAETALLLVGGVVIGTVAALLAVLPQLVEPGAAVDWPALGVLLGVVVLTGLAAGAVAAAVAVKSPLLPVLKKDD